VSRPPRGTAAFVAVGLAVAAALALWVSPLASDEPDGLERVAIDQGFADTAEAHDLAHLPTADYAVRGVDDDGLSTGLAGLLGVAIAFGVAGALTWLVRVRSRRTSPTAPPSGA
jgi:hypothetical protein